MTEDNTRSGIPLKSAYTPGDVKNQDYDKHLGAPGEYLYTRGRRATAVGGWMQRQLSGEGEPDTQNQRGFAGRGNHGGSRRHGGTLHGQVQFAAHGRQGLSGGGRGCCHAQLPLMGIPVLSPALLELMKEHSVDIPVVADGSAITPSDSKRLADMGIAAVFGPGVPNEQIIETIRRIA